MRRSRTLRLIVGYKFARGAASLVLAGLLFWFEASGRGSLLRGMAEAVRLHAVGAWSTALTESLLKASAEPHALLLGLALTLDGTVTVLEGWALLLGASWGPLLVAISMSVFVPFELVRLTRRFTAPRVALLALNLVIVGYLLARYAAERRMSRAGRV